MADAPAHTALELISALFDALAERDVEAVHAMFTDDAVLVDPHYPQIEMQGRAAIERGISWGMASMEQFGFTIVHEFSSDDGAKAVVEVDTHHTLKGGKKLDFPQMFIAEASDGRLTALRAYEPYRPDGVTGLFVRLSHVQERVTYRLRSRS